MKNILFDIDHTLLNTTDMAVSFVRMIAHETGLDTDKVDRYQNEYANQLKEITCFDFLEFIHTLPIDFTRKKKIESRYLNDSHIYSKYPQVDQVLNELYKSGYKIGIYSEGTPHFQENKLKNLHIDKFLDPSLIFITQNKRSEEYIEKLPPSIIVDDNMDVCNILAFHKRHKIIYLKRENKRFTSEKAHHVEEDIVTIHSLEELLHIL